MAKRSDFVAKNIYVVTQSRNFDITSDYEADRPLRGITEIESIIQLCEKHNSFISGGYARYCMSRAHNPILPADLDIFSSDRANHIAIVNDFLHNFGYIESPGNKHMKPYKGRYDYDDMDDDEKETWFDENETPFATSFKIDVNSHPGLGLIDKIQFVKPSKRRASSGPLIDILNAFDFTICKVALLSKHVGICHRGMQEDEVARLLRITGEIKNPIATFARILKYTKKGYNLSPLTLIKVLNAWKKSSDEIQLENLVEMAQYQLSALGESSEIDKDVDFFEVRHIEGEIHRLQDKLKKEDENFTPRLMQDWQERHDIPANSPDMYHNKDGSSTKPQEISLTPDGQIALQKRDRLADFGD